EHHERDAQFRISRGGGDAHRKRLRGESGREYREVFQWGSRTGDYLERDNRERRSASERDDRQRSDICGQRRVKWRHVHRDSAANNYESGAAVWRYWYIGNNFWNELWEQWGLEQRTIRFENGKDRHLERHNNCRERSVGCRWTSRRPHRRS